jgi:hypothetical protein
LPVETLLPSLSRLGPTERGVVIVWDKTAGATQEMRDQLLATIFRCYPGRAERPGTYFDEYFINRSTLEAALCGSGELSLAATGADGTSTPLLWSWTGAPISEAVLSCGLLSREALTIPAEALSGPGWSPEARFRQDFRGDGFLIDNYGSAEAAYALQLPRAGTYYVWVRSLRRRVDSFPAYLTFGDAHVPISGPRSPIDVWHWERLGPFQVNRVNPKLSLARPYAGAPTEFMALFFDEIVLTTDPTYDPQVDTLMGDLQKLPVDLRPGETEGHIDLDLPPGNYTCWLTVSDGDRIVDPYGDLGVDSDTLKIIIR